METLILFSIVWGLVCYKLAEDRNREPILGAIGGLLFGLFAVLYYLLAGKKDNK